MGTQELERYIQDRLGAASVSRSHSGVAFTVARDDLRVTGLFEFAARRLTLVSSVEKSSRQRISFTGLAAATSPASVAE
jgi:hypothetical protein